MLSYFYNDSIYNAKNDPRLAKVRTMYQVISLLEDEQHNLWFGSLGIQVICITETNGYIYNVPLST